MSVIALKYYTLRTFFLVKYFIQIQKVIPLSAPTNPGARSRTFLEEVRAGKTIKKSLLGAGSWTFFLLF